jgi:C1A family cysteine protease
VAFSIPVYHSWTLNPEVQKTGDIVLPIPNEDDHNEGHAMCLVGYEDLPGDTDTGGGRFLVRNSWESYWATESKLGIGYGTIPYSYIAKFGSEAYSID